VTSFSGDKTLTFSGLGNAPGGNVPTLTSKTGSAVNRGTSELITFTSGVSSAGGSLVAYNAEGPVTLNVTDSGSLSSTSTGGSGVSLTVSAKTATKLAYTTVPGTGTAGTAFSVTVQSQDTYCNPANPTSTTTITLSKATGVGTLSGTLTGNIGTGANSVTISTPVALLKVIV